MPTIKPRFRLKERAKKFGRYSNSRAACKTRSFVCFGIAFAAGESLMTTETVAGDKRRYSASARRLTGFGGGDGFMALVPRECLIRLERTAAASLSKKPDHGRLMFERESSLR